MTAIQVSIDPHFKISLCPYGTSADIQRSIWSAQHQCVSEKPTTEDTPPSAPMAGQAIIKHQLTVEHFSVLKFGFVKLDCSGFPRSMFEQIVRHKDSEFLQFPEYWSPDWLVQSNRYTGDRFCQVANRVLDIESVFYLRPVGLYKAQGSSTPYHYTPDERERDLSLFRLLCENYASKRDRDCPYEMARGILSADIRVNFTMAGSLEATWHWLDQRTKKDSQAEIRTFADMAQKAITPACPELSHWYATNRATRARLAP